MHLKSWQTLANINRKIIGVEVKAVDINYLFNFFNKCANSLNLPLYYWNLGYRNLQKVEIESEQTVNLIPKTEISEQANFVLRFLLESERISPGIYLLDDLCDFTELDGQQQRQREALIANLERKYATENGSVYLILLGEYLRFSSRLAARIPVLKVPLPDRAEVETLVRDRWEGGEITEKWDWQKLSSALQGLSRGEIELILPTLIKTTSDSDRLVERILSLKIDKWRDLGLEFIAEPDVESAGGNDLLQKYLYEVVTKLNESGARKYNLRPPRGMLLIGPPGTGKSLCAKLAAKALGYPLLGLSWGNVLGSENPDKALAQILEVADCLDNCVILADDFDKGFTGWSEGGASRRLSQRLLTWMQEHTSNALIVATVNRIQLLPSEIKRRFDDGGIWFVDLPHRGAMREIFQIHLAKYFPSQFAEGADPWSERDWYRLLKEYQGATPVEIANAVSRCAIEFYCNLSDAERATASIPATVTIEALLAQLAQFEMASVRDAEDLQAIRNKAMLARPASSPDCSIYAGISQELFEYKPHSFDN